MEKSACKGCKEGQHGGCATIYYTSYFFHPQEIEIGGSLRGQNQPGLHNEFQASWGYMVKVLSKHTHIYKKKEMKVPIEMIHPNQQPGCISFCSP